jgi:hypothetical protein
MIQSGKVRYSSTDFLRGLLCHLRLRLLAADSALKKHGQTRPRPHHGARPPGTMIRVSFNAPVFQHGVGRKRPQTENSQRATEIFRYDSNLVSDNNQCLTQQTQIPSSV